MSPLSSLRPFFWKYRWHLSLGILFVVLTNYFRIISPQLTGHIINTVVEAIRQQDSKAIVPASEQVAGYDGLLRWILSWFDQATYQHKILWAGILLLILALISGLFMFLMRQTIIVMSRRIEYDQKNQLFDHYQQLDAGFYKVHNTGDLMNRIAEDVSRVRMYTGPAIMYFINLAAVIGFSLFFMIRSDARMTLIALSPLPVLAITIYFVNNLINRKSEKIQALLSDLTTNAQETYAGIRVIKSFVQEKAMLNFFDKNSEAYRSASMGLAQTEAIYFPSMGLLIGLSTILTILIGGLDVARGVPGASVGRIAEFVMYIQMLTFPVSAIGWTASMTQRAMASQKRINEFLETRPLIQEPADPLPAPISGQISFVRAGFTYKHTGIRALNQFSLDIQKGQKIAIVGKTGSGKSTLAQILLRMYDLDEGMLLYDGIPVNRIDLQQLRSKISYVPQDLFLFSDTIEQNIALSEDNLRPEAIRVAARQAQVLDDIERFPQGMQTQLGERGVTLSGGQKQRVSIARALIKDAPIVIFDDCLSAVDSKTEKAILGELQQFLEQKTAIIITHRVFALLDFDQIIVMENGQMAESGTHETLMQQNGRYAAMYRKQQEQDNG